METRVFITGLNIISALGLNAKENWKNLTQGNSGISRISLFDPSELETQIAGEVTSDFNQFYPQYIKKRAAKQMTRVTKMGVVCAKEMINKSNIDLNKFNKARCAVIMGIVTTGNSSIEKVTSSKNTVIKNMNNAPGAWIAMEYGFHGPNYAISTACSSSAYAIAQGYDLIRHGIADLVIAGGTDSTVNPEEIRGFNELYALSTENDIPEKASKPFSKDRSGFVIGEGAGMILLEAEHAAIKRNAHIYAEVAGYALTNEAYNIMAPRTDGKGMTETMKIAIENSGINKSDIDYINAHGTSTVLNDLFETIAIKEIFTKDAYNIPISSSKSMIGHTIGAAGAIESAITAMSIDANIITPTINLNNPDPDLDLDYVPNKRRMKKINAALVNSFGFGGHNATLVLKKYT